MHDPLGPKSPPPKLTGHVHVARDTEILFEDLGDALRNAAHAAITDRGEFHLALSGGSTPEPFFVRMVIDPRYRLFPWRQTHIWLVDERQVPEDDEQSNFGMIRQTLIEHVVTEPMNLHPAPTMADDPAGAYEDELRTCLRAVTGGVPRLDFVLLGMGGDAHTASLFPHSPAIDAAPGRWIVANDGPHVTPPPRITMTFELLNAARRLAILVTGAKKHDMIQHLAEHLAEAGRSPELLPITGIDPVDGELTWYLDGPASGAAFDDAIDLA